MIGFINTSSSFSLATIQALQISANDIYRINNEALIETPLPLVAFDVTNYGIANDGSDVTWDMQDLANDTSITNWYFPTGSYKMDNINVPSHVVAIYGEGTIISYDATGNTDANVYREGAIILNSSGNPLAPNFVIDGLHWTTDDNFVAKQGYGMISSYRGGGDVTGIQIRNNTFDGNWKTLNAVKLFPGDTGIHSDVRVYNNESYNNAGYCDFEFITMGIRPYNSMPNFKFYNNYIHDSIGHGGLSVVMHEATNETQMEVYNNKIHDQGMSIEIGSTGIDVHHNEVLNSDGQALSNWTYSVPTNGTLTLIRNNHFETVNDGYLYSYGGSNAKIYDNFIRGEYISRQQIADATFDTAEFYNNTVVAGIYYATAVSVYSDIGGTLVGGSCHSNTVYDSSDIKVGRGIYVGNTLPEFNSNDNTIYMYSIDNTCMTTTGTDVGNTCTKPYTGPFPDSLVGSGLSDPDNVGRYASMSNFYLPSMVIEAKQLLIDGDTNAEADYSAIQAKADLTRTWQPRNITGQSPDTYYDNGFYSGAFYGDGDGELELACMYDMDEDCMCILACTLRWVLGDGDTYADKAIEGLMVYVGRQNIVKGSTFDQVTDWQTTTDWHDTGYYDQHDAEMKHGQMGGKFMICADLLRYHMTSQQLSEFTVWATDVYSYYSAHGVSAPECLQGPAEWIGNTGQYPLTAEMLYSQFTRDSTDKQRSWDRALYLINYGQNSESNLFEVPISWVADGGTGATSLNTVPIKGGMTVALNRAADATWQYSRRGATAMASSLWVLYSIYGDYSWLDIY